MSDFILNDVVNNFKLIEPSVGDDIKGVHVKLLNEYERLCKEKYSMYEQFYNDDHDTLLKQCARLGGSIGGVFRRYRSSCIISILETLKANNSKGFERFSITCFEELSKYLFDMSPSRDALIVLIDGKEDDGRITVNGMNIDDAIKLLCEQDIEASEAVTECYKSSVKSFKYDASIIKKAFDAKIRRFKDKSKK